MTTIDDPSAAAAAAGIDPVIRGLTADSRAVEPGFLFAALPGAKADGRGYIAEAARRGAVAVLAPTGTVLPPEARQAGVMLVPHDQPRRAFALMAASFHGHRQPATVVAVTGTNGKTSTVQFTRQLWERLGYSAGALGTLGLTVSGATADAVRHAAGTVGGSGGGSGGACAGGLDGAGMTTASMTTLDPMALHRQLSVLAAAGVDHLALEASSHGLDQHRLDGVRVIAAAFTNLTRDHLDYHGDMAGYFAAKAGLFDRVLASKGVAVLNADIPEFEDLASRCRARGVSILSYGTAGRDLRVLAVEPLPYGQRLALAVMGRPVSVELALVGRFQAWNVLAALGLALAVDPTRQEAMLAALPALAGIPGRLQQVACHPVGAGVIVDYAHSPDALETVLCAVRPHTARRLVVVFGCGGDRDRGKRPLMGALAARLADQVIVTDDNPRGEEPEAIRRAILAGCPQALEIGDRAEAIAMAVRGLGEGDVLVIAGKGHEQGQIVGAEVRPFDDATEARAAVAAVAAGWNG